jgi:hypothetical protein
MSIKIIELRQKDSLNVKSNGVYENVLNGEIIEVNDGDVIAIKNVFLDTTQQNQFIFENDVNLEVQYGVYIVDWRNDQGKFAWASSIGTFPPPYLTGESYIPYKAVQQEELDPDVFELVSGIKYNVGAQENSDDLTFQFTYLDINEKPATFSRRYPEGYFEGGSSGAVITDKNIALIIKKNSWNATPATLALMDENLFDPNNPFDLITEPPIVLGYEPYIFTANLVFPKGIYSPLELSIKLSEVMTNNAITFNDNLTTNPIINPFLKSIEMFDEGAPFPDGTPGTIPSPTVFYNDSLTGSLTFQSGDKDLIGASQIDFNYDSQSEKFSIQFLHLPIYDADSGQNISVRYLRSGSQYPKGDVRQGRFYNVGKHSGIYFNSLKSFDSITNEKSTFWEDLGFNLNELCVQPISTETTLFGIEAFWTRYNLIDGKTTCNGFVGNDSIIIKAGDSGSKSLWCQLPTGVNFNNDVGIVATTEATITIDAGESIPQIQTPFSHYLIDLNLGFANSYTDSITMYKNISSIVGRYYSYGSYLSDESGQITYTHRGNPLYIRSGKIRILTADKTEENQLGPDNTIMVQIIKNS